MKWSVDSRLLRPGWPRADTVGKSAPSAKSEGAFNFPFDRVRPFAGNTDAVNNRPYAELVLDEIRVGENYLDITPFTGSGSTTGTVQGLRREIFRNISGNLVSALTGAATFPNSPDQVDVVNSVESTGLGNNYGQRLSGVLIAPITGNYTFYVASDDEAQVFLSTDSSPPNKTLIAREPVWSNSRNYTGTAGQGSGVAAEKKSSAIALVAGHGYYFEVLQKQGAFGESIAVAWQKPGDAVPENGSAPIPGTYFRLINRQPVLASSANPAVISEDAAQQTINLSGLGGGPSDEGWQGLTITATSNNSNLIPNPTVQYTSPNATATLLYTPVANANGSATISVVAQDNGGTANGGLDSITKTFTVTVTPVNDLPRGSFLLNPLTISDEAGQQTATLTGITAGPGESSQRLTVTAISSDPSLIPNPTVQYTSPQSTATLTYAPVPSRGGSVLILVLVNDDGGTSNGGLDSMFGQFTVTVTHVNREPSLAAITDRTIPEMAELRFTPAASDPDGDTLTFSLETGAPAGASIAAATGVFSWTPTEAQGAGTYSITARVRDNGTPSLSVTRSFQVTVAKANQPPVLSAIATQTIDEQATLSVTTAATDSDVPANLLTFSLPTIARQRLGLR